MTDDRWATRDDPWADRGPQTWDPGTDDRTPRQRRAEPPPAAALAGEPAGPGWPQPAAPPADGGHPHPPAGHPAPSDRSGPPVAEDRHPVPAGGGQPDAPAPVGHHHHGPAGPASAHTRRAVFAILIPAAVATLVGLLVLWPGDRATPAAADPTERAYGEVVRVVEEPCPEGDPSVGESTEDPGGLAGWPCGTADVRVTKGAGTGQTATVELPRGPGAPGVAVGDDVVLLVLEGMVPGSVAYTITDHQRGQPMIWLVALTAAVIIGFGRWRGVSAIAGLVVSFAVLLLFVIPAILAGSSPLLVAVVGAATIMFAVLYLTHGTSVHTSVAILGTLAALVLTGLLGAGFTALTQLTGIGSEESAYLAVMQGNVDMRGLLLAGIIIGALGALDDVTVTQAMTVAELSRHPMSRRDLYRAAARVGRSHVGSAVNTLVLAYAGASLPLMLLIAAGGQDLGNLLTSEFLAEEIVRSAVGTIGLVAAVPITTVLAVLVAESRRTKAVAST
ncbi:YibE/F family protein [Polymorphospora sp. NPDC051019]|uniref:YibE/F family protein n=1 Tax=Polymorphospora sp. NPDC051019 TaxID=3155725 RepID=UPI003416611F